MRQLSLFPLILASVLAIDPYVLYINELQSPSGGFHEAGVETPDLRTTADALLLTSLYGLKSKINADDAATFVQNHENTNDHGYYATAGQPSDIESSRFAVFSYVHLGKAVPNAAELADFVRSLFNVATGLFASRSGEPGDLRSTALAVETLDILGKPLLQESLKKIKDLLAERVDGTSSLRFKFDDESASPLTDNYHGILLAKRSGFALDAAKYADFINSLQDTDSNSPTFGGFYSTLKRTVVTAEATSHAALSLHLLGEKVANEAALARFASQRKASLAETVATHLAFATTSLFKETFSTRVLYDANVAYEIEDQVMEGLQLKPAVVVTVFDGKVPHGGFAVTVQSDDGWNTELEYDHARYGYLTTSAFDTEDKLGSVTFTFKIKTTIYPIGDIEFTVTDSKRIGYHLTASGTASYAGRVIEAGESVLAGTEFFFDVSLATSKDQAFFSGPFVLDFSVLDASGVVQHHVSIDGSTNEKPIGLGYVLTGEDFPSGPVTFLFEVKNKDGVHTRHTEVYNMEQQMVASHIKIVGGDKLGSLLQVSMQPGSLKDLHTSAAFSAANAGKRKFVLDLVSPNGATLLSIDGVSTSGDVASYSFEASLPASIDFIGTFVLSFRFVSTLDSHVKLHPFDAENHELYDDVSNVQVTVKADVHLSNVQNQLTTHDLKFGSSVPFKFQLKDSVSGKNVVAGAHSSVSVALASQGFVSSRVNTATDADGFLTATIEVDANAVQGASEITVEALGVDGTNVPILKEGSSHDAVKYPVNIGGKIEVSSSTYSTSGSDATATSFILTFSLTCEGKPLKNAHLGGLVTTKNGTAFSVVKHFNTPLKSIPVTADQTGKYSFSFSLPHDEFPTGEYKVDFLREVDVARAKDGAASPLFDITLQHKKADAGGSWLQMEILIVVFLTGVYVAVSSHSKLFDKSKEL